MRVKLKERNIIGMEKIKIEVRKRRRKRRKGKKFYSIKDKI